VRDDALALAGVTKPLTVLIIHGHGNDRIVLRDWIQREVGLSITDLPMMGEQWGAGRTLPEKFEDLAAEVDAAIAIATPDDVGGLNGEEPMQRARQNVWLEVGWFWGRLGRERVMLLCKGDIEFPSDLRGIEFYLYTSRPEEVGDRIRQFISRIQRGS
jgi:predicted nucleotide-binding protein